MEALEEIVQQGKARFVGLSNFTADEIQTCMETRRDRQITALREILNTPRLHRAFACPRFQHLLQVPGLLPLYESLLSIYVRVRVRTQVRARGRSRTVLANEHKRTHANKRK